MAHGRQTTTALGIATALVAAGIAFGASCGPGGSFQCVQESSSVRKCVARDERECRSEDGCTLDVGCQAAPCPTPDTSGCGDDRGCFREACLARIGCEPERGCSPSGEGPCRQIEEESECGATEDCVWGPRCSGTLVHCADFFDDESACRARSHCVWSSVPGTFY
jgi:hypothetical protein